MLLANMATEAAGETEVEKHDGTASIALKVLPSGELELQTKAAKFIVVAKPCFPWSCTRGYISLRDRKGKEHYFVHDLTDEPAAIAEPLKQALALATYTLDIEQVIVVTEDCELRLWQVKLAAGEVRQFQTKIDEWPVCLPGGGLLIQDVFCDLYHVAKPNQIDEKSRKQLWAFLD